MAPSGRNAELHVYEIVIICDQKTSNIKMSYCGSGSHWIRYLSMLFFIIASILICFVVVIFNSSCCVLLVI